MGDSGALKNSDACIPELKTSCDGENPKESESPRVTSAPRKRFPGDIKSFSHDLNSNGIRPFPFWKPKRLNNLEVLATIRTKFDKSKEEVDYDLHIFAADLIGILEKGAENHPEWQETIEDLLVLARSCAMTSPGEFWLQCEGIVQELDDRRQELPMGMLKQLHTRMLFILARCTRLLQFHKENWLDEHFLHPHRSFSQEYGQVKRNDANQSAINEAELAASSQATSPMPKHDEEGPTLHMEEDYSRVCAIPDLRVNERLTRITNTLEKLMGSFSTKDMQQAGSPDGAKVSSIWSMTEDSELVPPKVLRSISSCKNRTVIDNQKGEVPPQLGTLGEQAIVLLGPTQDFLDLVVYRTSELVVEDEDEPKEWTAQVEPGVQIIFASLPRGGNDLKRIRFTREMFNKWQAQRWWDENFDRIRELYNVNRQYR